MPTLNVTDVAYLGGGVRYTFDDGSVGNVVHEYNKGVRYELGLNDEQAEAVARFNKIPFKSVLDPRFGGGDATTINGLSISDVEPTNGQVLIWNSTTNMWTPGTISGSGVGDMIKAVYDANDNGFVDNAEQLNDGVNVVTAAQAKTAYDHSQLTVGNPHNVNATDVGADLAGTAASLISIHESTYDHTNIGDATTIQGNNVSITSPSDGQVLIWNNSTSTWEPGTVGGSGDMLKSVYDTGDNGIVDGAEQLDDGTNTATAAQVRTHLDDVTIHRTINDAGSGVTDLWSASKISSEISAAGGGTPSNTVTAETVLNGAASSAGSSTDYSRADHTHGTPPMPSAGDVGADAVGTAAGLISIHESTYDHTNIGDATTIQGNNVSITSPSDGQVLIWNNSTSTWEPGTVGGSGDMLKSVYDTNSNNLVDDSENTRQLSSDGGTSNVVTAVEARTHLDDATIHRTINDAGSGVTDLWSASKISSEISAASGGTPSNTVTAETVLNGAASSAGSSTDYSRADHTHGTPPMPSAVDVGADAAGTAAGLMSTHNSTYDHTAIGNAVQIQSRDVAATAPADGQVLAWNNSTSTWEPQTAGGTGDMLKSVYDTGDNGIVDSAEAVEGVATAGNDKYYGTNAAGTPGFYDLPTGGGGSTTYMFAMDASVAGGSNPFATGSAALPAGWTYVWNGTDLTVNPNVAGKWAVVKSMYDVSAIGGFATDLFLRDVTSSSVSVGIDKSTGELTFSNLGSAKHLFVFEFVDTFSF